MGNRAAIGTKVSSSSHMRVITILQGSVATNVEIFGDATRRVNIREHYRPIMTKP
jgi:hypothetical protein